MNASNPYAAPNAAVADVTTDTQQPAGRGARFGAAMLDGILACLLVYVPAVAFVGIDVSALSDPTKLYFSAFGGAMLAGFILWGAINLYFVAKNSQTVGKKLIGIKVARSDGTRASLGRIFWLRNVVNGLITVIPIVGGLYALVDHLFIFSERRQCLHDKIADTVVVNA